MNHSDDKTCRLCGKPYPRFSNGRMKPCYCNEKGDDPHEIHVVKLSTMEIGKLRHALADARNLPAAYDILVKHHLMDRTPEGYKSLDPRTIQIRIGRLLGPNTQPQTP